MLGVEDHLLDISSAATPCRIRLVECRSLVEQGTLRIVEFPAFPAVPYSTISYPWRGVSMDPASTGHVFAVAGAEDGDPVGTDVLRDSCAASLARGNSHLWLDRLCIVQTSPEDKRWQIKTMYKVYQSCRVCIVVAGGVRRLVRLDEETSWIHRSWTLQEVLAPPEVVVLFNWKLGPGKCLSGGNELTVEEVTKGESAIAPLSLILQACTAGHMSFTPVSPDGSSKPRMIKASMMSALPQTHSYNDIPFWQAQRKILAPNVAALTIAMDAAFVSDPDIRAHSVWQSALMRTSSRPVDMVFSIMGLFGVTLDPARFDNDDRRGATIALAQAILDSGRSASWLGVGLRVEPDRTLSTFPTFPKTSVAGAALVRTRGRVQDVSELVDAVYPVVDALVPLPRGHMSDAGYLTFTAKAVKVHPEAPGAFNGGAFAAADGSRWVFDNQLNEAARDAAGSAPVAFACLLGWFNQYHPGETPADDKNNIRAMLLEEHKPGLFHVRSSFALDRSLKKLVLLWPEHQFCVGGREEPGEGSGDGLESEEIVQTYSERETPWPRVPGGKPVVTAKDELIRKARWAVPQRSLERYQQEQS
ncbi:hypothetical protein GGX14DRAFT_376385 [Mycena pura]|uniref:Heterokaryon incompatibility domain-containing protein n=1 Tax=Mycena pura TaxID=153505 RepID=A0AAD6Y130_9AGAR|nr:hypothetical protein GGX14DRAFT_376385 [Mycena pura]